MEPASIARGTQVAGYVIEERIGAGGFGEVYRATHPVIGRTVAIKVLHAKYCNDIVSVTRFISEARAVNRISHPNIVEVFDFGTHEGRELFVMELLAGNTLRGLLDERGRIPLAEAVPLLRGIADAVDAAHAAGIAHRDLKPDNVFVLPDGRVKLIDFGIAKLSGDNTPTLTETGSMLGTPQYMSPEQCRGRPTDLRTDQYSFGALAYHVLVGEPPFTGDPIEIALHHLNDRPVPPSKRRAGLPPEVDRALLALLAKDPAERPSSCRAAVEALTGERTLELRWSRRTRLRIAAVPIAAIAVAGGVLALRSDGAPRAVDRCVGGTTRLAGVWDPVTRAATIGRLFAHLEAPPWTAMAWRDALAELDDFADRWSTAWDGACNAERTADPLIYGQRVTCLENSLLDLRTMSEALRTIEPTLLADVSDAVRPDGLRGRLLVDCASDRVLRAQVPAPPLADRDRIAELLRDGARAQMEVQIATGRRDTPAVDQALGRIDTIARTVEAIDAPSAASLISWRAIALGGYAFDVDSQRRPAARTALLDGIARIERSGDNVALASALLALAGLELDPGDGDSVAKVSALLPRVEAAIARAGEPALARRDLALVRGELAMRRGRFAEAIAPLQSALELSDRSIVKRRGAPTPSTGGAGGVDAASRGYGITVLRRLLFTATIAAGRGAEAETAARAWREELRAHFGGDALTPISARLTFVNVLDAVGKLDEAMAVRRDIERDVAYSAPHQSPWTRMYLLDLELRLGRQPADAEAAIRAIAGLGTTPSRQNPDGPSTVRRAGMFEAFARGIEHASADDDERVDNAAILAFQRGDRAAMAKLAADTARRCRAGACTKRVRQSRWLAIIGDGSIGRADADAAFAALEREYTDATSGVDQFALANTGIALAVLGRWADAKAKLEAARGEPHVWESQADLVELDAWLGLARVHANQLDGARLLFEESLAVLSIWNNGFDGFSYTTPIAEVALADILWNAADGDKPRARRLVEHAIAGFARLGSLRDRERADAQRWLDQHPAS